MKKTVLVKQLVLGDGIPKICIPLTGKTEDELLLQADLLKNVSYDLVEWRADFFSECFEILSVKKALGKLRRLLPDTPILFTFRTMCEGGTKDISFESYLSLNLEMIDTGLIDLIDVEFFSIPCENVKNLIHAAHEKGIKVVASNHDFCKTPSCEELVMRLTAMREAGADLPKIAVMPTCKEDVLTLLMATHKVSSLPEFPPVITMSMGSLGSLSRILGEFTGSCLTFGTAGEESAPGQIPAGKLKELLTQLHEIL